MVRAPHSLLPACSCRALRPRQRQQRADPIPALTAWACTVCHHEPAAPPTTDQLPPPHLPLTCTLLRSQYQIMSCGACGNCCAALGGVHRGLFGAACGPAPASSANEATHPRCCDEGYPDGPGRASNKEGEPWGIISTGQEIRLPAPTARRQSGCRPPIACPLLKVWQVLDAEATCCIGALVAAFEAHLAGARAERRASCWNP